MREYDLVRIVKLNQLDRHYDGSDSVMRPPRVGDVGAICHEDDIRNSKAMVSVEMVDENGLTLWLTDFYRSELELVRGP